MGLISDRKQIIGFAKFHTRADALHARDVLSGRRVDAEKGSILKAEMAKKNLHTKRGLSNDPTSLPVSAPSHGPNPVVTPGTMTRAELALGIQSGSFPTVGPYAPGSNPARRSMDNRTKMADLLPPAPHDLPLSRPRSPSSFDPFLANSTGPDKKLMDTSLPAQRSSIDFNAFLAMPNPHHSVYAGRMARAGSLSSSLGNPSITRPPGSQSSTEPIPTPHDKPNDPMTTPILPMSNIVASSGPSGGSSSDSSSSTGSRPSHGSSPSALGVMMPVNHLAPEHLSTSLIHRTHYPADQNPAINTLYVGGLPTVIPGTSPGDGIGPARFPALMLSNSVPGAELEERLRKLFSSVEGFKRFSFRAKSGQPMCFIEFINVSAAKKAMESLYGHRLDGMVPGGIRLAFSRNALGKLLS